MSDLPSSPSSLCRSCGNPTPAGAYFCPHCGKPMKDPPLSTSVFMLAWVFFLSVFVPPLGLWPGIKYFKHSDPKTKRIGLAAIVLTVLSSALTIYFTFKLANVYVETITQIPNL